MASNLNLSKINLLSRFFDSRIYRLVRWLKYLGMYILRLLRGRVRKEFVWGMLKNRSLVKGSLWMSIFVTTSCNLNCKECIMGRLRKAFPGYQMSLNEIGQFIEAAERSHYRFDLILTGGEPLSWDYLREGVKLLKRSASCNSLCIFTNAMDISKLDQEIVSHVDKIRISKYHRNADNAKKLVNSFGNKIEIVDREEFWQNPVSALSDVLPARCCNAEYMLFNYKVYACPHSASIAFTSKSSLKLYNPLGVGFINGLYRIRNRQQSEICSFCISNLKVRNRVAKIPNC